ncbi:MAG: hypothetical protein Q9159_000813 [Coniocarpon cinnabarinum]
MASQGDPAIEPEFDTFSRILPLPFRVATIIVLGVWAWGLNLQYLRFLGIDVPALIRYPARSSPLEPPHHFSTYRLATLLTLPLAFFLLLFWLVTHASRTLVPQWEILPNLYLLVLLGSFLLPLRALSQNGRYRFLHIMRRISVGGLAQPADGKFGDILLADVLTSYSKVLGDLFVALCMMLNRQHSTSRPNRGCGGQYIVPFLISVPFLIRLRQCLIEYVRVRRGIQTGELDERTAGWGGQHLANALKYSTAFPVTILSALQRGDQSHMGLGGTGLFRLWMLAVFVNSFYSFYWDVAKDWDLSLFDALWDSLHHSTYASRKEYMNGSSSPTRYSLVSGDYPYGLRRNRYMHSPNVYYVVIGMDLMLRCTWSLKLSPHLDHFNDLEGGIFVMQLLEVFRRWMWMFFRIETEWVRGLKGPAMDDVPLGNLDSRKLDED